MNYKLKFSSKRLLCDEIFHYNLIIKKVYNNLIKLSPPVKTRKNIFIRYDKKRKIIRAISL